MTYDEFMKLYPQSNFRPPPARESFADEEEFEEARGYWQSRVGRSMAMYHLAQTQGALSPDTKPSD